MTRSFYLDYNTYFLQLGHCISAFHPEIVTFKDKSVAAVITSYSFKILSESISNYCAVFWRLISFKLLISSLRLDFRGRISSSQGYVKQHAPTNAPLELE